MQGSREGRLSLRLEPALHVGKKGRLGEDFPYVRASTKCMKIGKARRKISLRLEPAIHAGKYGKQGDDFPYI